MGRPEVILATGVGGASCIGFCRSIRLAYPDIRIIGVDADEYSVMRGVCDERYVVPGCRKPDYIPVLNDIIKQTGAGFLFSPVDVEIVVLSDKRDELAAPQFLPDHATVKICQSKYESYLLWEKAGIKVPKTYKIEGRDHLKQLIEELAKNDQPVWIRFGQGAFGKGALPARTFRQAEAWIDLYDGWDDFLAAEYLSPESITWQSIWENGEMVVAQARKRLYWEFANRTLSGVTGITGTGQTVCDTELDEVAVASVKAIDSKPHGVFSVDLTYDSQGRLNPTEINIGRFFTTHFFFSQAGLNMPAIMLDLASGVAPTLPEKRISPLEPDLLWIRGMDVEPVLSSVAEINGLKADLEARRARLAK